MKQVGILSDTHGFVHSKIFDFFKNCDEIWHAGDIGSTSVLDELSIIAPIKAVFGNCDNWEIRDITNYQLSFQIEQHKVAMMHITGYPRKFTPETIELIAKEKPTILVGGHSHILKIINDPVTGVLHINPGAAGNMGIHTHITFIRLKIDQDRIFDLEVFDSPRIIGTCNC